MNIYYENPFTVGEKVEYISYNKIEKGIVKSISDDYHVFVVYHCGDDWHHYRDYTAARTNITNLSHGWPVT